MDSAGGWEVKNPILLHYIIKKAQFSVKNHETLSKGAGTCDPCSGDRSSQWQPRRGFSTQRPQTDTSACTELKQTMPTEGGTHGDDNSKIISVEVKNEKNQTEKYNNRKGKFLLTGQRLQV